MKYIARVLIVAPFLALSLWLGVHNAESAKPKTKQPAVNSSSKSGSAKPVEQKQTSARAPSRVTNKSALDQLQGTASEPTTTTPLTPVTPFNPEQTSQTAGAQSTQAIQNNWISINQGGATEVSSGNLKLGISIAQPVAGYVESGNLALGLGYWYGAAAGGGGGCDCPWQSDYNEDGNIDAIDLNGLVDVIFYGGTNIVDPSCPGWRMDFNCSGDVDAVDINFIVDYIFYGGGLPCDPCACTNYPSGCSFP